MQTFIISSKTLEKGREKALVLIKEQKINKFDTEILEFEKALGIEDVRNIQKKIFLKPFRGEKKALIVKLVLGATVEAQNSMLKFLEEPPPSSLIFILTDNHQAFLPTILSRCKLIDLDVGITPKTNKDYSDILKNLKIESVGEALKLAQDVSKDKQEAIIFLEDAILAAREEMLRNLENKQDSLRLRKIIHRLELAHYDLKTTNVNPRLCLENLFLSLAQ